MNDRQNGCTIGRMDAGQDTCRTEWMQDRTDIEQYGCRSGQMQDRAAARQNRFRTGRMLDRADERRMQDRIDAGKDECWTGQIPSFDCSTLLYMTVGM